MTDETTTLEKPVKELYKPFDLVLKNATIPINLNNPVPVIDIAEEKLNSLEKLISPIQIVALQKKFETNFPGDNFMKFAQEAYEVLYTSHANRSLICPHCRHEAGNIHKAIPIHNEHMKKFHETFRTFTSQLSRVNTDTLIGDVEKFYLALNTCIATAQTDDVLRRYKRIAAHNLKNNSQLLNSLNWAMSFTEQELTSENVGMRAKRARGLSNVDISLATLYIARSRVLREQEKQDDVKDYNTYLFDFWQRDTDHYSKVLGLFKPIPKPKPISIQVPVVVSVKPAEPELNPYEKLVVAITPKTLNPIFSSEKYAGKTINEFLNRALIEMKITDGQANGLSDAFEKFNLPGMMSRKALSPDGIERFFTSISEDLTHKIVPNKRDLRELYQECLSVLSK